jgi:hypothetical protein
MSKKMKVTVIIVVVLTAVLSWAVASASSEEVRIYAGTDFASHYDVYDDEELTLYFGWGACSEGLVLDFKNSITEQWYTLDDKALFNSTEAADKYWTDISTIYPEDEVPWFPDLCMWDSERGGTIFWEFKLGKLKPGDHVITAYRELSFPIIDGADLDNNGALDVYDQSNYFGPDTETITIHVEKR